MPRKKGRLTSLKSDEDDVTNQISLKDRLENLDEKSRRRIDYLINDFKLQRQHRLENIDESKKTYFNLIDAYYDKIPKIVPRRYLDMKFNNFEVENACLTINYKKFINKNKLANLKFNKGATLKYGGTPAKFKVTYSATKRKSQAKSEIKKFEFKVISDDGNKTIISSTKRSNRKRFSSARKRALREQQSILNSKDQSSLEENNRLLRKQQDYLVDKIKQNSDELINKFKKEKQNQIDHLFKNIINSFTESQLNSRVAELQQKNIINQIFEINSEE